MADGGARGLEKAERCVHKNISHSDRGARVFNFACVRKHHLHRGTSNNLGTDEREPLAYDREEKRKVGTTRQQREEKLGRETGVGGKRKKERAKLFFSGRSYFTARHLCLTLADSEPIFIGTRP